MKKYLSILLAVLALTLSMVGCGNAAANQSQSSSQPEVDVNGTHTVVDHGGNTVEVPDKITRVVIDQIPILSTYMSYFQGSAPNIVG